MTPLQSSGVLFVLGSENKFSQNAALDVATGKLLLYLSCYNLQFQPVKYCYFYWHER